MKKIGFIDLYISEWHANNYPAWIKEACEKSGLKYEVAYCWAERDVSPVDGVNTEAWCKKNGVQCCDSIEELCEKSDRIIILAPSNPEAHLVYAQKALKYGKPIYIDKTFAPCYEDATEIFRLSRKYGTPIFSTSALRYANELDGIFSPESIAVTGGGSNLPEYFVHLGEITVRVMGCGIESVTAMQNGTQQIIQARYTDGRTAAIIYGKGMPYNIYYASGTKEEWKSITSPFFVGLISDILRFFETGKPSFSENETLEVIKLRDAALKAVNAPGTVISL